MSKVINLKSARKSRTRADKRQQADVNALSFGRTKADRNLTKSLSDKATQHLNGHKRDRDT